MRKTFSGILLKIGRIVGNVICAAQGTFLGNACKDALSTAYRASENAAYKMASNGEERVLRLCLPYLNAHMIWDVGANKGDWSKIAQSYAPQATMHLFEPIASTYADLVSRWVGETRVKIHNVGLGEHQEELLFERGSDSTTATACKIAGMRFHEDYYRLKERCRIIPAKALITSDGIERIDFCKIDCEGMDFNAIKGFGKFTSIVRVFQFEYGIFQIGSRDYLRDFWNYFDSAGFVCGKVYPHWVKFGEYALGMENYVGSNYLAVKKSEEELIKLLARRSR